MARKRKGDPGSFVLFRDAEGGAMGKSRKKRRSRASYTSTRSREESSETEESYSLISESYTQKSQKSGKTGPKSNEEEEGVKEEIPAASLHSGRELHSNPVSPPQPRSEEPHDTASLEKRLHTPPTEEVPVKVEEVKSEKSEEKVEEEEHDDDEDKMSSEEEKENKGVGEEEGYIAIDVIPDHVCLEPTGDPEIEIKQPTPPIESDKEELKLPEVEEVGKEEEKELSKEEKRKKERKDLLIKCGIVVLAYGVLGAALIVTALFVLPKIEWWCKCKKD